MIWLWVSLAGWLAGARGTYGWLAHRGALAIEAQDATCSHGFSVIHEGEACHGTHPSPRATTAARAAAALAWCAWLPLYLLLCAGWNGWTD